MNKRFSDALDILLIAAMFAIALWVIRERPAGAQIAIHWGPDGQPDAWMGERAGFLVVPIIALIIGFVRSVFPQTFSRPGSSNQSAVVRRILLILLAVQLGIAANALGHGIVS